MANPDKKNSTDNSSSDTDLEYELDDSTDDFVGSVHSEDSSSDTEMKFDLNVGNSDKLEELQNLEKEVSRKEKRLEGYKKLGIETDERINAAEKEYQKYYDSYVIEASKFFQEKNPKSPSIKYVLLSDYDQCLTSSAPIEDIDEERMRVASDDEKNKLQGLKTKKDKVIKSQTDFLTPLEKELEELKKIALDAELSIEEYTNKQNLKNKIKEYDNDIFSPAITPLLHEERLLNNKLRDKLVQERIQKNRNEALYSPQNQAYRDAYIDSAAEKNIKPEEIHLGRLTSRVSTKQDNAHADTAETAHKNKTGTSFNVFSEFAKLAQFTDRTFSFDDFMYEVQNGEKILREKHDFEYDTKSKILQILLHTLQLSEEQRETAEPNKIIRCIFSDDNQALIDDVNVFFSDNPALLPRNIHLLTVQHEYGALPKELPSSVIVGKGHYKKGAAQRIFTKLAEKETSPKSNNQERRPVQKSPQKLCTRPYHVPSDLSENTEDKKNYLTAFSTDILGTDVPVSNFSRSTVRQLLKKASNVDNAPGVKNAVERCFTEMHTNIRRTYEILDKDISKHQAKQGKYAREGNDKNAKLAHDKVQAAIALKSNFTKGVTQFNAALSKLNTPSEEKITIKHIAHIASVGCKNLNRILYGVSPKVTIPKVSAEGGNQLAQKSKPSPANQNNLVLLSRELYRNLLVPYDEFLGIGTRLTRLMTFLTSVFIWGEGVSTDTRTEKHLRDKAARFFDAQKRIAQVLPELDENKIQQVKKKSEQAVDEHEASRSSNNPNRSRECR